MTRLVLDRNIRTLLVFWVAPLSLFGPDLHTRARAFFPVGYLPIKLQLRRPVMIVYGAFRSESLHKEAGETPQVLKAHRNQAALPFVATKNGRT